MATKRYTPRKMIVCDECEEKLHISEFFKGGTTCLKCLWALDFGIKCIVCGSALKPAAFEISADKTYRKATCKVCCDIKHAGGKRGEERRSKHKICKCGEVAVDCFKGEYMCYKCLNPASQNTREDDMDEHFERTSAIGNGLEELVTSKAKPEQTFYVHRVTDNTKVRRRVK